MGKFHRTIAPPPSSVHPSIHPSIHPFIPYIHSSNHPSTILPTLGQAIILESSMSRTSRTNRRRRWPPSSPSPSPSPLARRQPRRTTGVVGGTSPSTPIAIPPLSPAPRRLCPPAGSTSARSGASRTRGRGPGRWTVGRLAPGE